MSFTIDGRITWTTDLKGLGSDQDGKVKSMGCPRVPGYIKLSAEAAPSDSGRIAIHRLVCYPCCMPRTPSLTHALLLVTCATFAARTLPQLPPPDLLDTEVSTNCPISNIGPDTSHFDFSLTFAATPSNNVEAAFGTDANANGVLEIGERSLSIGWDCGSWFVAHPPATIRLEESADAGAKTLSFALLRSSNGSVRSLAVLDGTNAILGAFTETPRSWAFDPDWNLMSLTARGVDSPGERFTVRFAPDGILIRLR